MRVLVVEDEKKTASFIRKALQAVRLPRAEGSGVRDESAMKKTLKANSTQTYP